MANLTPPDIKFVLVGVLLILLAWFGFSRWDGPGDPYLVSMSAAHRAFEDAEYERALQGFVEARRIKPAESSAVFGQALALMQLGRSGESLAAFELALDLVSSTEEKAFFLANRGILHDREYRYPLALADYELAMQLSMKVVEGPGFVSQFVHNRAEKQPTIADRAQYLRQELAKPEGERQLSMPDQDVKAYPYRP